MERRDLYGRLSRLPKGFSRKKTNLRAAPALYFAYYNFVRFHKSVRVTPAMKTGITRKPWSLADLLKAAMASRLAAELAA